MNLTDDEAAAADLAEYEAAHRANIQRGEAMNLMAMRLRIELAAAQQKVFEELNDDE